MDGPFLDKPNTDSLIDIDLRNNKLESIDCLQSALKKGLKVRKLLLNDNRLGHQFEKSSPDKVFEKYPDLEMLDMTSNEIKTLPVNVFKNQSKLTRLNLSKNYLSFIEFNFAHMTNLRRLDFSNNLLIRLDRAMRDKIDSFKLKSPEFMLGLRGNPIECSCDSLDFLEWIYRRQSMMMWYKHYTCLHNNTIARFDTLKDILDDLDFKCSMHLTVIISTSLLAFLVAIVGVSVLLYRHRWEIRFFCVKFVVNRRSYESSLESPNNFEYDAFVAYHSDDGDWIRDELYEHLDRKEPEVDDSDRFRLCIHGRDFIPGTRIEDNIVRAIESSRRTILVLSRSFLTSMWCEFELQMARMESFDKGRNLIIVVMLESIPAENMSKSLRLLILKNTYIEWFEDPVCKTNFWKQMRAALGTKQM